MINNTTNQLYKYEGMIPSWVVFQQTNKVFNYSFIFNIKFIFLTKQKKLVKTNN